MFFDWQWCSNTVERCYMFLLWSRLQEVSWLLSPREPSVGVPSVVFSTKLFQNHRISLDYRQFHTFWTSIMRPFWRDVRHIEVSFQWLTVQTAALLSLQVTGRYKLWGWMRQEFLPNIYSHPWYNGRQEKDVYVENKVSLLVGTPWMRQLRVKKSKLYNLEFAKPNFKGTKKNSDSYAL